MRRLSDQRASAARIKKVTFLAHSRRLSGLKHPKVWRARQVAALGGAVVKYRNYSIAGAAPCMTVFKGLEPATHRASLHWPELRNRNATFCQSLAAEEGAAA